MSEPERIATLRARLDAAGVAYSILRHEHVKVHSTSDGVAQGMGRLESMAPTFIVRSEQGPLCAIASGAARISWRKLKKHLGLKDASLASPDAVRQLTGAEVGAVCMINDGLSTLMDARLLTQETVYGGCGIPGYTLAIAPSVIAAVTKAQVFDFCELKADAVTTN